MKRRKTDADRRASEWCVLCGGRAAEPRLFCAACSRAYDRVRGPKNFAAWCLGYYEGRTTSDTLTIRLPFVEKAALLRLAAADCRTATSWVRLAIQRALETEMAAMQRPRGKR